MTTPKLQFLCSMTREDYQDRYSSRDSMPSKWKCSFPGWRPILLSTGTLRVSFSFSIYHWQIFSMSFERSCRVSTFLGFCSTLLFRLGQFLIDTSAGLPGSVPSPPPFSGRIFFSLYFLIHLEECDGLQHKHLNEGPDWIFEYWSF